MGLKERGEQNINDMKTKRENPKGGILSRYGVCMSGGLWGSPK